MHGVQLGLLSRSLKTKQGIISPNYNLGNQSIFGLTYRAKGEGLSGVGWGLPYWGCTADSTSWQGLCDLLAASQNAKGDIFLPASSAILLITPPCTTQGSSSFSWGRSTSLKSWTSKFPKLGTNALSLACQSSLPNGGQVYAETHFSQMSSWLLRILPLYKGKRCMKDIRIKTFS